MAVFFVVSFWFHIPTEMFWVVCTLWCVFLFAKPAGSGATSLHLYGVVEINWIIVSVQFLFVFVVLFFCVCVVKMKPQVK